MSRRAILKPLALIAVAALFLAACVPPKKVHVDYARRIVKIRTVAILTPASEAYELPGPLGGRIGRRYDWAETIDRNLVTAVSRELTARGFAVKVLFRQDCDQAAELNGLLSSIARSFKRHASRENGPETFPHKAERFEYSLGPLGELLDSQQADALFLINGYGRYRGPDSGRISVVDLTLADRSGELLWLERVEKKDIAFASFDIRKPAVADVVVKDMFASLREEAP
jgi:hypothetical protein